MLCQVLLETIDLYIIEFLFLTISCLYPIYIQSISCLYPIYIQSISYLYPIYILSIDNQIASGYI